MAMRSILHAMPLLTALVLSACSSGSPDEHATVPAASLETHVIAVTNLPQTRDWDGRIEAIDRATLAAQTGGRVTGLPVDVGDVMREIIDVKAEEAARLLRLQSAH